MPKPGYDDRGNWRPLSDDERRSMSFEERSDTPRSAPDYEQASFR